MNTKTYFTSLSNLVIAISIIIGLSAIFLVERIIPAIDEILQENVSSVSASMGMLHSVSMTSGLPQRKGSEYDVIKEENSKELSQADQVQEEAFWKHFKDAKNNITLKSEAPLLVEIKENALSFWSSSTSAEKKAFYKISLSENLSQLAQVNLKAMEAKDEKAKFKGLTGAWVLGLLLIASVLIQLWLRTKILGSMIAPVRQILSVLEDYSSGNKMRRFVGDKTTLEDVKKTGILVNQVLDEASFKLKSKK